MWKLIVRSTGIVREAELSARSGSSILVGSATVTAFVTCRAPPQAADDAFGLNRNAAAGGEARAHR